VLEGDLADPEVPQRLVSETVEQLGACDLLIANAGVGTRLPWDEVDLATWDHTIAVNLRAPWLLTQAALPGMLERGFGRILFTSSVAGFIGGAVSVDYASSKAGLHGLTHFIASRVARQGVTVNAIAPALIEDTAMFPGDPLELAARVPVGRLGKSSEVADLALAILRNGYITSQVMSVDGGIYPH
jgi:3-oxoacyl-[acyl-carrier protein] reductase